MGWRKYLFDKLLVGAGARLSRQYYEEALAYTDSEGKLLLHDAVRWAVDNSPYYERVYAGCNLANVHSLPILTKKDIRAHAGELLVRGADASGLDKITTSGSTGYPVRVLRDEFGRESTRATEDYYFREFLGIDQAEVPSVVFWANSPSIWGQKRDARKRFSLWLTRTSLLGASRFTPDELRNAIETINHRKPVLIKGYATTLLELARYVRENNLKVHKPRMIVSLAETLYDHPRQYIEETFGCRIFDYYGSREVGPIAGQCAKGILHLFEFNVHTEVIGSDGMHVGTGNEGRVVVTQLRSRAMPLIRYELGDIASTAGTCTCGSGLPGLTRVIGRITDYFPAEDGSLVYGGYFIRVLYGEPWIEDFQIVQKSVHEIEISYVAAEPATDAQLQRLREKVSFTMGPKCKLVLTKVDIIPTHPSGKKRHAISEIRVLDRH